MEIFSKKEVKKRLGVFRGFSKKSHHLLTNKVKYLAGVPALEELKHQGKFDPNLENVFFLKRSAGLEIRLFKGIFDDKRLALFDTDINYWSLEHHDDISQDKTNSIVGKALVGGLLFGVGGAVVGGMSEAMDKATHILSLSYTENKQERIFLFSSTSSKSGKVYDYMQANFESKYIDPNSLKEEEEKPKKISTINQEQFSIADELQKLNELKESGILTEEEFEEQKQKLLSG